MNLNFYNIMGLGGSTLEDSAVKFFGNWNAALCVAGLDPVEIRVLPPPRNWSRELIIDRLREHAELKRSDPKASLGNSLRLAMDRHFGNIESAFDAAGLNYEEVHLRGTYRRERVARVVDEIRSLEGLKGRERRQRLDQIYRQNSVNHRVVKWRFGSLRQLAAKEGIPYHIVAPQTYRDEADVQHDLDILESQGLQLSCSTILQRGYKRLYDVIRETGWGAERVKAIPLVIWQLPPCDPHSGLLHDRMIKNIREWIYPDRPEVRDLLLKATAIDAVPVLIARRIPFVTFYLLQLCGAIVHQTFNQLLPSADQDPADLAKHKNNLGFHDIRTGNTPDKRMTKFIGTNLPAVLPKSYPVFLENKDLLRAFASQEITYRQFAAKLTTESNDPDPADFY